MALFKLLFLFTLVVVYRREWLEKQLARHLRSLKLFLGPWWPLRDGALGGSTAASAVDLSWTNQARERGALGGGRGAEAKQKGDAAGLGTVHAARVTDKMLHEQSQTNTSRAAAAAASAAEAAAGRGVGGVSSSARTAAALESQWDKRLRRKGAGRSERDKTLLELVAERRQRAARAQERHRAVRAHIRQRREERGLSPAEAAAAGADGGEGGDTAGGDTAGMVAGRGVARRRNWLPRDLVEDVNGVKTYDPSEVEVGDNQMFCTVVKKNVKAEM